MTIRQLFYRLVSIGALENSRQDYVKVSRIMTIARNDGRVEWDAIVDRSRPDYAPSVWDDAAEYGQTLRSSYRKDYWRTQPTHVEIWVEKDAVVGSIEDLTDYPFFTDGDARRILDNLLQKPTDRARVHAAMKAVEQDKENERTNTAVMGEGFKAAGEWLDKFLAVATLYQDSAQLWLELEKAVLALEIAIKRGTGNASKNRRYLAEYTNLLEDQERIVAQSIDQLESLMPAADACIKILAKAGLLQMAILELGDRVREALVQKHLAAAKNPWHRLRLQKARLLVDWYHLLETSGAELKKATSAERTLWGAIFAAGNFSEFEMQLLGCSRADAANFKRTVRYRTVSLFEQCDSSSRDLA